MVPRELWRIVRSLKVLVWLCAMRRVTNGIYRVDVNLHTTFHIWKIGGTKSRFENPFSYLEVCNPIWGEFTSYKPRLDIGSSSRIHFHKMLMSYDIISLTSLPRKEHHSHNALLCRVKNPFFRDVNPSMREGILNPTITTSKPHRYKLGYNISG